MRYSTVTYTVVNATDIPTYHYGYGLDESTDGGNNWSAAPALEITYSPTCGTPPTIALPTTYTWTYNDIGVASPAPGPTFANGWTPSPPPGTAGLALSYYCKVG